MSPAQNKAQVLTVCSKEMLRARCQSREGAETEKGLCQGWVEKQAAT